METIFLKLNSIDLNFMLYDYDHLTAIGHDADGHEFKIEIEVTKAKELCLFDNKNIGVNNMALEKHHKIVNELEYLTLKNGYPIERLHELLGFEYSAKMREHFKKLDL